ncbi:alpha/beta hydrolase, partial [Mycobacteroides abscessus subsp. abscessus]
MPFVDVNGQRIHYTDSGEGPVIVATHATLMDTVSLEPLTSRLPGRVVSFDLRGHGKTVYDKQPYDYNDVAEDVLALVDHLG